MRRASLWVVLAVSGCMNNSAPDVAAYKADVAAAKQQVTTYESSVTVAPAGTDCAADRDRYLSQLKASLDRMRSMSIGFDGCMGMMQHRETADFQMMCTDLDGEVDRYRSAGCSWADASANRRAALEHCARMTQLLDQAVGQASAMQAAMGGSTMHGCR